PRAPHHERSAEEIPVLVRVPVVRSIASCEERKHTVHRDIGEQHAPTPWQMLEVRREDTAVDDVAKIHDQSRSDHYPQRCFCYEEWEHGELGRAGEYEHAHRNGLRLCQDSAHHRDARHDPPGHNADEEPGRCESALAKGGNLRALHFPGLKTRSPASSPRHTETCACHGIHDT